MVLDTRRLVAVGTALLISSLVMSASPVVAADAPVADAMKARDVATVGALLKKSVDVNAAQADGTTALHWAAYWDDLSSVDTLLAAGAKVDASNRYGVTPLFVAATNGNAALVERLLKAGANAKTSTAVNPESGEGESALLAASRTGNADAVKAL